MMSSMSGYRLFDKSTRGHVDTLTQGLLAIEKRETMPYPFLLANWILLFFVSLKEAACLYESAARRSLAGFNLVPIRI